MRVRLIHWRPDEAGERADLLREAGIEVDADPFDGSTLKTAGKNPPDAFVIDLTRIPSQGRDLGIALRRRKSTRAIPLVFAGGEAGKVERVRELLPDAVFTSWEAVAGALERAVGDTPRDPVVPDSQFAAYSGRPLAGKLGITRGRAVLIGAPGGFESLLGDLPPGVSVSRRASGRGEVVMLFARSMKDLVRGLEKAKSLMAEGGSLWIAWPKKSSGAGSDLTQAAVRSVGLDSGLVDYRICSIDGTWSGLRFARRD